MMTDPQIIQTRTGMSVQIIPRQSEIPPVDPKVIQLQHITYYGRPHTSYEGEEITEEVIAKVLEQIPKGINIYLSLIPYGEDDWLEVNSDGTWLALAFRSDDGQKNYYYWNPQYAGVEEWAPVVSDGQSPIEKYLALTDIEAGVKAAEYFIRTGQLYPGIDWAEQV